MIIQHIYIDKYEWYLIVFYIIDFIDKLEILDVLESIDCDPLIIEGVEYNIDHDFKTSERPIKYIMRHKVNKSKFKITTESGKEIIVTGDHSVIVIRNNELCSIPAKSINKNDKIITISSDI